MSEPALKVSIRAEAAGDEEVIFALTKAAFANMPFSDGDEQHLVTRLREDGDLTLSLVAEHDGRVVGHIAFSPVEISDGSKDWFGLGPVSVWPDLHHQRVGSALILEGIDQMRARGARGIVLLGSNEYYPRFGFAHHPQLTFPGPPPEYFQALAIAGEMPCGKVTYAKGFYP